MAEIRSQLALDASLFNRLLNLSLEGFTERYQVPDLLLGRSGVPFGPLLSLLTEVFETGFQTVDLDIEVRHRFRDDLVSLGRDARDHVPVLGEADGDHPTGPRLMDQRLDGLLPWDSDWGPVLENLPGMYHVNRAQVSRADLDKSVGDDLNSEGVKVGQSRGARQGIIRIETTFLPGLLQDDIGPLLALDFLFGQQRAKGYGNPTGTGRYLEGELLIPELRERLQGLLQSR